MGAGNFVAVPVDGQDRCPVDNSEFRPLAMFESLS
jgi:hypothetical protein